MGRFSHEKPIVRLILKGHIMIINFFETNNGMDENAIRAGVYMVELINIKNNTSICLYVGESVWIASRCGKHLYSVYEDPRYFGLKEEDINNDDFILKFSVVNKIDEKKSVLGCGTYKEQELKVIEEYEPITQLKTSDRQIRNIDEKIDAVQNAMKKSGFK